MSFNACLVSQHSAITYGGAEGFSTGGLRAVDLVNLPLGKVPVTTRSVSEGARNPSLRLRVRIKSTARLEGRATLRHAPHSP